jgi:hypothetical protein
MVLTSDVRRRKLDELQNSGEKQGCQKLYYRGQTELFDVFRIDLDALIYNRHNGRLEVDPCVTRINPFVRLHRK